ncbi:MAG: PEP-CTERM sorting domain-containing protein [Verrucomicrobiales bacterium]
MVNPYEFRVGFGGRTGGENALQQIDNVIVNIPEPGRAALVMMGLLGIALRRRK